jgi:CTP synthase
VSKFIFITGGVVSSLGKGISGASIGKLLQCHGFSVNMIKFDPYINVDPGTMNPYQHGEVFVTVDGAEADLDLGTYERFLDICTSKANTNTSGDIYRTVIDLERRGFYDGQTVQVIPHITDEIKKRFSAEKDKYDITIIEIGGTVGDIEGLPFMEAVRQFMLESDRHDTFSIHVSYVPYIIAAKELKTKPTQHSVNKLREIGIFPDMIICRSDKEMDEGLKSKISLFCNVRPHCVVEAKDSPSIYFIPETFKEQNVDKIILDALHLKSKSFDNSWIKQIRQKSMNLKKKVNVAVVGKYAALKDAYKSIHESLQIAATEQEAKINIEYLGADDADLTEKLSGFDGVLVPGGFGQRGVEGKISAISYARKNHIPFFGICLGLQCAVIEIARNVLGLEGANSAEFDENTPYAVVKILKEQKDIVYRGATMRLGSYEADVVEGTLAFDLYKKTKISERHRHRYEMNPDFVNEFKKAGLNVSAYHKHFLPEIVELEGHPFFIAVQFHPEFASRPMKPHPIFAGFIKACLDAKDKGGV